MTRSVLVVSTAYHSASLCGIIGICGGDSRGGFGEGLTDTLPTLVVIKIQVDRYVGLPFVPHPPDNNNKAIAWFSFLRPFLVSKYLFSKFSRIPIS